MKRSPKGIGRYPSLDDTYVYTSWTRTRHGWWVAFATPAAPIDGAQLDAAILRAVRDLPADYQVVLCAGAPDTPEIAQEVASLVEELGGRVTGAQKEEVMCGNVVNTGPGYPLGEAATEADGSTIFSSQ